MAFIFRSFLVAVFWMAFPFLETTVCFSQDSSALQPLGPYTTSCDTMHVCNVHEMIRHYTLQRFDLDSVRKYKKVPRLYVANFPKELRGATYKHKKQLFIGTTLAAILKANEEIAFERTEIECLSKKDSLTSYDSLFLKEITRRYYANTFEEMLEKVDGLPPSLVIAQGINESGWGTSFFALQANSIFGMKAPAKSSLPTIKHPKHGFKTYKFNNLEAGIEEYILNINRHRLYKPLREIRAIKRQNKELVTGYSLLKGMKKYSSRRQVYVNTIRKVIKIYDLQDFDDCVLEGKNAVYLKVP